VFGIGLFERRDTRCVNDKQGHPRSVDHVFKHTLLIVICLVWFLEALRSRKERRGPSCLSEVSLKSRPVTVKVAVLAYRAFDELRDKPPRPDSRLTSFDA
jgi:hypothetical protein